MQDISDACGLTKAGLYYYIRSKEEFLLEIMSYGMDIFEERVLLQVLNIGGPVEHLKGKTRPASAVPNVSSHRL